MASPSRGSSLEDLDLTGEEVERLSKAFQDEGFRALFAEYAAELADPAQRALYEAEVAALERQRGVEARFLHPSPGWVLRTSQGGRRRCYLNLCANPLVGRPRARSVKPGGEGQEAGHGQGGGCWWSLPHCLAPGREELSRRDPHPGTPAAAAWSTTWSSTRTPSAWPPAPSASAAWSRRRPSRRSRSTSRRDSTAPTPSRSEGSSTRASLRPPSSGPRSREEPRRRRKKEEEEEEKGEEGGGGGGSFAALPYPVRLPSSPAGVGHPAPHQLQPMPMPPPPPPSPAGPSGTAPTWTCRTTATAGTRRPARCPASWW
ncbi:hypothetical protein JRQ81_001282 [Phrynocephalus forsythii]|uniref:PIH1 N-terminal domain-containing protein n=1 Tax=Phrynocephalus forsythii TaxID=171643 RepID=A0A9Q1B896_9SAUR|nr:hypothetical protein JRQ81_001282 [Phrynocephalus forsythii]